MDQIGEMITGLITKEVVTVVGAMFVAWLGWKTAVKTKDLAIGFAKRASFAGLASAALVLAGMGGMGVGIGELSSRIGSTADKTHFNNDELIEMARATSSLSNNVEEIMRYAEKRDERKEPEQFSMEWVSQQSINLAELSETPQPRYETPQYETPQQVNSDSIMILPAAWGLIGLGIAGSIVGLCVFSTRRYH